MIELALARATGRSDKSVFDMPGEITGSKDAWYGIHRKGIHKPGWQDIPQIAKALEACEKRARYWVRKEMGLLVEDAFDILLGVATDAATRLATGARDGRIEAINEDGRQEWRPLSPREQMAAAESVLDRLSTVTAPKGTLDARIGPLDELSDDELAKIAAG